MTYKFDDPKPPDFDAAHERPQPAAQAVRGLRLQALVRKNRVMLRRVGLLFSLAIVAISMAIFIRTIWSVNPQQLLAAFAATSSSQIASACGLAFVSYLALTGYDRLALAHLHEKVPLHTTALASFTSYAVSFTLGFPLITGGAVRYWIYGAAGLSAARVARLTIIAGITFWLGMGLVMGSGLFTDPDAIGDIDHLSVLANQILGAGLVAALAAYIAFVAMLRSKGRPKFLGLELPGPAVTLGQIALGVIDIGSAAATLFVLLPKSAGISYVTFSALYSFASMLGIASHAPGGIGVFEATMLRGVGGPTEPILASLFLFRAIYYLIPFILAMALLGAHEALRRWRSLREALDTTDYTDES